ncbi:MAG: gliding motility-associated C-terminal domain-containing protein [Saprospiraceae bacterium]|nr:gliding motility-associated C-terminal domain-containing protein [Saprospiraceae bacterium]MCF8248591.1 gliding motility-associated C-terminal domain-containing protein [Saprospiraceae bacterium]MCF8281029.1 gliding motility-associated C-terminal domain-containing protein [Bacteroidales bacterium]MCF8310324.1 gliding motility-associated C-terminal domain-containing protein [Saprospiraceae bacterium]MCF8443129.1 gliding motility-associated C-terminal domain-containing protein [Saprospiraceae 
MKKIICLLAFFSFLLSQKAFAQPTYCFSPQQVEVNQNDIVNLDLTVKNFTDIISSQFTITFDPNVLQFQSITNLNAQVTGLDMLDFGTATGGLGYITFIWDDGQPCQAATNGVTIADGQVLFRIRFTAIGDYGFHTPVQITDSPIDRITRRATAACFDIGELICNSFVSIGTSPLKINISSADGQIGDVVCIDFKVEDFNDLISAQYFIFWDTSILEYYSAMTQTLGNTGDVYQINYSPAYGMLASVWYNNSVNSGVTLADGTQILQMCFKIKGNCGQSSPIYISQNFNSSPPEPIEIIDAVTAISPSGVNIGLLQTEGTVTVNCNNNPNGIGINLDDKNVCPGETFTVDVKIEDFSQIVKMMFDLKWNPAVIQFQGVTYPTQSGGPACLPFSTGVGTADVTTGRLHMDWETQGQGCNKPNGYIVMRLEFKAVGPGGSNSTISVVNPIFVDKFGGLPDNVGINVNNSLVTLCDTNKPTIVVESINGTPGETVCVDLNVQDFNNITSMDFALSWNESILQLTGIQGLNLNNLTMSNFDQTPANFGLLGLDWSAPTAVTLPDGTSIFTLCFKILGDPGECSTIEFDNTLGPIVVENNNPDAGNVGLNGQPGTICALDPFILHLSLPDVFAAPFSVVCVDLTAENFNQLTKTQYTIFWKPNMLQFDTIISAGTLGNFGPSSYDLSNTNNGYLNINWTASNQILGTSVADGSSLFKICFKTLSPPDSCSNLTIGAFPASSPVIKSATTGSANLNLATTSGSVCVRGTINLVNYNVTEVTCGANPDGAIALTVNGGSGQYNYQWTGSGVNPTAANQINLNIGYYTVTITDAQNPLLQIIQPFTVAYAMDATFANAGQDTTRACNAPDLILNGTASSSGPNTTYAWQTLGFGLVTANANSLTPTVVGTGSFILTVTGPGCIDKDTVMVGGTVTPVPHIDTAEMISCKQDTVVLNGTMSPFGYQALWTGPAVVASTETSLTAKVTAPGWYFLTLGNPGTTCPGIDSIEVFDDMVPPFADAGLDTVLGCSTPFVPIGGSSSTGPSIMYDWVPVGNSQLCGNPQAATLNACSPGIFQLTVLDTLNGCSAMDEIVVTADTLKPISNSGADKILDCSIDSVTLDGSASSTIGNYSYSWTLLGSAISQGNLTINVSAPGIYELVVIDNDNNCSAVSEVEVIDQRIPPAAMASHTNDISCLITTDTLSALGSATGPNISYEWFDGSGISAGTGMVVTISTPGIYDLVVTNATNHCTSTGTVDVGDLTTPLPAANAGADTSITCFNGGLVVLQGNYDVSNPNLQIQWTHPTQGCLQNGNTATPTISCPGTYVMQVYNNLTGCVGLDTVLVNSNNTAPTVNAGPNMILPCPGSSVVLEGSTNISNFTVNWGSVPNGLPIVDPTTLNPTVTQPGTYSLTVQSTDNGCTSSADLVIVTLGNPNLVADAGTYSATNCQDTTVTLNGSNSTHNGNMVTWQLLDGTFVSDQIMVPNMPAGIYELIISTSAGCEARDTAVVNNNSETFTATATSSSDLSCDITTVDLNGSSTSSGTTLNYVWTNESGMIVGSGQTIPVSDTGTYTLTVTNGDNGCSATTSTQLMTSNPNLEMAAAQTDHGDCEPDAMLMGNLPAGTTGVWTSPTGAVIENPSAATTTSSDFIAGGNIFIWTLSLGDCLNYDSDTVSFTVNQATPNAVNDNTTLLPGTGGQISFNVLENDEIFGGVNFTLLPNSVFGNVVANDSGIIVYTKEKCVAGKVEIPYQICDQSCPDLCDQATLLIDVIPDPNEACGETPNGITPNGDGINDELVFDELLNTSEVYPDNEIVIFNRWGDVVFQAKPYLNNWGGTNKGGDELPHATYYYILRLNIANGQILRGDVTILK